MSFLTSWNSEDFQKDGLLNPYAGLRASQSPEVLPSRSPMTASDGIPKVRRLPCETFYAPSQSKKTKVKKPLENYYSLHWLLAELLRRVDPLHEQAIADAGLDMLREVACWSSSISAKRCRFCAIYRPLPSPEHDT